MPSPAAGMYITQVVYEVTGVLPTATAGMHMTQVVYEVTGVLNASSSSSSSSSHSPSSSSSPHSSSSLGPFVPVLYCRRCSRLAEPSSRTTEQLYGPNLWISVTLPFDIVNQFAPIIPNAGPDTLVVNYTDNLGQPGQFTRNVTFTMSDNGYVLLSADLSQQLLIASVNAQFWQSNALAINGRNAANGSPALLPCCNADRYDAPTNLLNQQLPTLYVRDGAVIYNPSSSSTMLG